VPQSDAKQLLPIIAKAFADVGYRRATTAMLARACGVRENVIYRVWPSKKAMFLATIDYVWDSSRDIWRRLLAESRATDPSHALRHVLQYESTHHGEVGLYRIVFTGLSETDDPEIAAAMRRMYENFHAFIAVELARSRGPSPKTIRGGKGAIKRVRPSIEDDVVAWALVGLATVANIGCALGVPNKRQRSLLYTSVGTHLIDANEISG
jgi:AcrR family transcriptional regulator